MATPSGPPPGMDPRYIQQMMQAEAQRRGMTMEQLQQFHRQQVEQEAAKLGITPQQYVETKRREAMQQMQQQQQAQRQAQGQGQPQQQQGQQQVVQQQIPLNGSVQAKPEAIAVAKFLRSQDLKTRTCIFDGQRKDMFKVKRALRALESNVYKKARTKNPLLPEVTNKLQAQAALQMLPVSMLALRVEKADPHEGHNHAKKKEKRVKGLWTVKIEQHQAFEDMMHYVWLYEGPQWKAKLWAGVAVVAALTLTLYPLWPLFMRQGVWYLSVACLGLLGLFFAMAIFRLILFLVTVIAVPPGLWLFPNLFEDVGFFDSFKPVWGWQETKKKKKSKKAGAAADGAATSVPQLSEKANGNAVSSGADTASGTSAIVATKRHMGPTVEEAEDE